MAQTLSRGSMVLGFISTHQVLGCEKGEVLLGPRSQQCSLMWTDIINDIAQSDVRWRLGAAMYLSAYVFGVYGRNRVKGC